MPQKGSKKKKSAQKKQGGSRYVIPPLSPIATRSKSESNNEDSVTPAPTPTPGPAMSELSFDSTSFRSVVSQELQWDSRMDKMEDNMTFALLGRSVPAPVQVPARAAPTPVASHRSHAFRGSSRLSCSASSSISSTRSSSRHASSSSRRHRHHSHRSRSGDRSSDRGRRSKNGKYTTLKYLPEFTQVSNYERLVLANARMALKFYKKGRDISGILDHIILVAEKAEPGVFDNDALIRYDDSVKLAAYENGLDQFKKLDPAAIVKHLSYDGTKVAANSKRSSARRVNTSFNKAPSSSAPSGHANPGPCYKFNFANGGCRRSRCDYCHVCSACFRPGHVNQDCTNVDRSGGSNQK